MRNTYIIFGVVVLIIIIMSLSGFLNKKEKESEFIRDDRATILEKESVVEKQEENKITSEQSQVEKQEENKIISKTATEQVSINIENFKFKSGVITIKKGATVTWINNDSVGHTVTAEDTKNGPNSNLLKKGEVYSFTFNSVGEFPYFCTPHPFVKGKVIVTE